MKNSITVSFLPTEFNYAVSKLDKDKTVTQTHIAYIFIQLNFSQIYIIN